jgi:NAD+ kinase
VLALSDGGETYQACCYPSPDGGTAAGGDGGWWFDDAGFFIGRVVRESMDVGVVAQKGNGRAATLAGELREELVAREVTVGVDEATASELDVDGVPVEEMRAYDLVCSIGGDGTFLYAARGANAVPILGVNLGEVGFLNAVPPEDAHDELLAEVARFRETGTVRSRSLPRLTATGDGDAGDAWSLTPAINEIVVQGPQRGHGAGAEFEVCVDSERYSNGHADGVLVATATGSTAYNLSEGGPLVTPTAGTHVVTEMCATDGMPPLVAARDQPVTVHVTDADSAHVISDGRETRTLDPPATVEIGTADDPVRVAGPPVNFFEALGKLD